MCTPYKMEKTIETGAYQAQEWETPPQKETASKCVYFVEESKADKLLTFCIRLRQTFPPDTLQSVEIF